MLNAVFLWHCLQSTCKHLWGKGPEGIWEVWGWPLRLCKERRSIAWVCVGLWLTGQLCRPFLPHSPGGLSAPPIIFHDSDRHTLHPWKCHLTVCFPIELLKFHFFLRKILLDRPIHFGVGGRELDPNWREANGFIPFWCVCPSNGPRRLSWCDNT